MQFINKAEVEEIDRLMSIHRDAHTNPLMCNPACRKLALMLAINSVLKDREPDEQDGA